MVTTNYTNPKTEIQIDITGIQIVKAQVELLIKQIFHVWQQKLACLQLIHSVINC